MAGGLISAAPRATAGCVNAEWVSHNSCAQMSAGQPPGIPILSSPPTHIDDGLSH
jgi:hypothetical protein